MTGYDYNALTKAGADYINTEVTPSPETDAAMEARLGRHWTTQDAVRAIEAEAVAAERARILMAVEGLRTWKSGPEPSDFLWRADVIAIVKGETP